MKTPNRMVAIILGTFSAATAVLAEPKVEQQPVGPALDFQAVGVARPYVVSPQGVHLATINHKGSRVLVTVDGVAGPKFDEIVVPSFNYIDPRPYQNGDINLVPRNLLVTFSQDGKRYAYVGRQGQEWVLMVDNKETLRIPISSGTSADLRLTFAGDDGKHLLLARAVYGGYEMYVDGQKWPGLFGSGGGGSAGTIDPLISADGAHIAYMAQMSRDKQSLIVDGAEAVYFGDNLSLSADGQHLYCINHSPKGDALLKDGKSMFTARQIVGYLLAPAGDGIIAQLIHQGKDGSTGYFLLVNGKPVEASLSSSPIDLNNVRFSPDGKHFAGICGSSPNQFVVNDGKKGQEYQSIMANMPNWPAGAYFAFSPDSTKLVYVGTANGKQYAVVNDDESDGFDNNIEFNFSDDGKHLAYSGFTAGNSQLFVDGKKYKTHRATASGVFFRPDAAHFAYTDQDGIYFDGQPAGLLGGIGNDRYTIVFSPDSQHYATIGARASDQKFGLIVDGQLVYPFDGSHLPRFCRFTADSQHLYWFVIEPAIGANAGPGKYEWVTYLDGKPVARCEGNTAPTEMLYTDYARTQYGIVHLGKTPPAWNVGPDGVLNFLGIAGDSVMHFTVTPAADSSIATMLAGGKGGTASPPPATSANPKSATATPAANPAPPRATTSSPPANTATNKVATEINEAADKTKAAADAIRHLFGK
jgi:hypothetical protein